MPLGVGVVGVERQREAAARKRDQGGIHAGPKLLKVPLPAQNRYKLLIGKDLRMQAEGRRGYSTQGRRPLGGWTQWATDLHSIVLTLVAVLQVEVDEPQGDAVTFLCAPAPVVGGVRWVSVRIPRRLHPPQQHGGSREGEQEKQQKQQTEAGDEVEVRLSHSSFILT